MKKVRAVKGFVARMPDGKAFRAAEGDVFDLPDGVDWLICGHVVPVRGNAERAVIEPREQAVLFDSDKRKPRGRKA